MHLHAAAFSNSLCGRLTAAPWLLHRRWDAKTLANIALFVGVVPYLIYKVGAA